MRSLLLRWSLRDACVALSALVSACATGESLDEAGASLDAGAVGSGGSLSSAGGATLIDDTVLTPVNQAIPTCTDGVQNGGETGLDCGGPDCAPC